MTTTNASIRIDSAITRAIRAKQLDTRRARLVRAIMEVTDAHIDAAIRAAYVLDEQGIMPHQIRTNYRAAGITYDLVNEAFNN